MSTSTESRAAPYVSKTTFLSGLQCSKLLWSIYNARHLFPKVNDATQSIFDQANAVGAFAKRMFPTGIEIDTPPGDFDGAIQLTQAAPRFDTQPLAHPKMTAVPFRQQSPTRSVGHFNGSASVPDGLEIRRLFSRL